MVRRSIFELGGLDETTSVPSGRAARPAAVSSVGPIAIHYWASLRPCLGTAIAPRRRARFRQSLRAGSRCTLAAARHTIAAMLLSEVGYARPETLEQALEILVENPGARALA